MHPINTRPSHDTSPQQEEKIEAVQQGLGVVTIETDDCTHQWQIWETLAKGSLGIMRRGEYISDRSEVTLKFMKQSDDLDEKQMTHIQKVVTREVAVLSEVQHENVIRMMHHFKHAKYPDINGSVDCTLLVLEYASKGRLRQFIKGTGYFPDKLARTYFYQMLSGLEALHLKGFAHLNLQPENMLLDENYTLKLAGFGYSRKFYDAEQKKFVNERSQGDTRVHCAPEMHLKMKWCGNQVDMFALGVTLFCLCFGVTPFRSAVYKDDFWRPLLKASDCELEQNLPAAGPSQEQKAAQYRRDFWTQLHEATKLKQLDKVDERRPDLTALLIAMMHGIPEMRCTIVQAGMSKWLKQGKMCDEAELEQRMRRRWITVRTRKDIKK